MPTFLSLFSGVGGLDLAMEAMGFDCIGQVEWDASCTKVLARHWPDVPRWGDVVTYSQRGDGELRRGSRELVRAAGASEGEGDQRQRGGLAVGDRGEIDLICGGFPCQPVSQAGGRKAQADSRWLWPEFARCIGELRPRHVVVENVPGLLTANGGRAFSEVLGDLASLGYVSRWHCVRASDVGAPHRRERVFLLAHAEDADGWIGETRSTAGEEFGRRGSGSTSTFAWGPYAAAIERWEAVMGPAPHPVDERGRLDPTFVCWMMGFPAGWVETMSRTQALKALGNAVVPQQAFAALSSLRSERKI